MSRRVFAIALFVSLASVVASAQNQTQSGGKTQGILIDISVIEVTQVQPDELEKLAKNRDQMNRLASEGKARLVAGLQVRTKIGEEFTARSGQRVPIQTATLPVVGATDRSRTDSRGTGALQGQTFGISQIEYENVGLSVDGSLRAAVDGQIDIRLRVDITGVDRTGSLTPSFTQRSFTDVARMKENETVMLISLTQDQPSVATSPNVSGAPPLASGSSLIVMLTTRPVQ